jgi:hypothetical protein
MSADWQSGDAAFEHHWSGQAPPGGEHPWPAIAAGLKRLCFDWWNYGRAIERTQHETPPLRSSSSEPRANS